MFKNVYLIIIYFFIGIQISYANGVEKGNEIEEHPDIAFENPDFDFGKIFRGEKVEHVYKFKNIGKCELVIDEVKTSCGCTVPVITSLNTSHNETGKIKVLFNTKSKVGKITNKIIVKSNDPDTPEYELTISGLVVEELVIKPRNLDFSTVLYGTGSEKNISMKSVSGAKLKINQVDCNDPNIITSFKESDVKGEYIVAVSLKKDTKQGRLNGKIYVQTNSKNMKTVKIPFFGQVVGDLSVYPPRISFGIIKQKTKKTIPVFATAHKQGVKIEKLEVVPDFFKAKFVKDKRGDGYKIFVALKKNAPVGKFNGELQIFTNSKDLPVVNIPLVGIIKEGWVLVIGYWKLGFWCR